MSSLNNSPSKSADNEEGNASKRARVVATPDVACFKLSDVEQRALMKSLFVLWEDWYNELAVGIQQGWRDSCIDEQELRALLAMYKEYTLNDSGCIVENPRPSKFLRSTSQRGMVKLDAVFEKYITLPRRPAVSAKMVDKCAAEQSLASLKLSDVEQRALVKSLFILWEDWYNHVAVGMQQGWRSSCIDEQELRALWGVYKKYTLDESGNIVKDRHTRATRSLDDMFEKYVKLPTKP